MTLRRMRARTRQMKHYFIVEKYQFHIKSENNFVGLSYEVRLMDFEWVESIHTHTHAQVQRSPG